MLDVVSLCVAASALPARRSKFRCSIQGNRDVIDMSRAFVEFGHDRSARNIEYCFERGICWWLYI